MQKQEGGEIFKILEFRTMKPVETHKSAHRLVDIERNSKVTRVGRLLRAIALDELRKLINIQAFPGKFINNIESGLPAEITFKQLQISSRK